MVYKRFYKYFLFFPVFLLVLFFVPKVQASEFYVIPHYDNTTTYDFGESGVGNKSDVSFQNFSLGATGYVSSILITADIKMANATTSDGLRFYLYQNSDIQSESGTLVCQGDIANSAFYVDHYTSNFVIPCDFTATSTGDVYGLSISRLGTKNAPGGANWNIRSTKTNFSSNVDFWQDKAGISTNIQGSGWNALSKGIFSQIYAFGSDSSFNSVSISYPTNLSSDVNTPIWLGTYFIDGVFLESEVILEIRYGTNPFSFDFVNQAFASTSLGSHTFELERTALFPNDTLVYAQARLLRLGTTTTSVLSTSEIVAFTIGTDGIAGATQFGYSFVNGVLTLNTAGVGFNASTTSGIDCSGYGGVFSTSYVEGVFCRIKSTLFDTVNYLFVPPTYALTYWSDAMLEFKSVFPFNIFFGLPQDLKNITQAVNTASTNTDLPLLIVPTTITIFYDDFLVDHFGQATSDLWFLLCRAGLYVGLLIFILRYLKIHKK